MKRIIKHDDPPFLKAYTRKNPGHTYQNLNQSCEGKKIRSDLKTVLIEEQKFICGYCCRKITDKDSHNEHIKPQDLYPQLSLRYDNMIASCNHDSCGQAKRNHFNPALFVSPIQEDCERHFAFDPDGTIYGVTEEGQYTIDLLKLNCKALRDIRSNIYKECECLDREIVKAYYIDDEDNHLPACVDFIEYFFKKGFFDTSYHL